MYDEDYICVISQEYFTNIISYHDSTSIINCLSPYQDDVYCESFTETIPSKNFIYFK
jgi:hypothetical protein